MADYAKKYFKGTPLEPNISNATKNKRINNDINFFKNFLGVGSTQNVSKVTPSAFNVFKNIFFKPKQSVLASNVPKFSAQELKKFPLNRYNKSTPYTKDEIIFKNTFQNAKNASKTPLPNQMNGQKLTKLQEAYLANKIRPYAKAGGGLATAGILEEVLSDAGTNKDSIIKPSTNEALRKNGVPIFNANAIDDAAGGYYDSDDKSFIPPINDKVSFNANEVDDAAGGYYDPDDAALINDNPTKPVKKSVTVIKKSKPKQRKIVASKPSNTPKKTKFNPKPAVNNIKSKQKLSVYNIMDADKGAEGRWIDW